MNIPPSGTSSPGTPSSNSNPQGPDALSPRASAHQAGSTSNESGETPRALDSPRRSAQQARLLSQVPVPSEDQSERMASQGGPAAARQVYVRPSGALRARRGAISGVGLALALANAGIGAEPAAAPPESAPPPGAQRGRRGAIAPGLGLTLEPAASRTAEAAHPAISEAEALSEHLARLEQSQTNLMTVVDAWYGEADQPLPSDAEEFWSKIKQDKPDLASAFGMQLNRMRGTKHYERNREDITQRVVRALDTLKESPDALNSCMLHAVAAAASCRDGTALAFVSIEETILKHPTAQGGYAPSQLVDMAKGLFRSHRLDQLANDLADKLESDVPNLDRAEIILRVRVALSAELDLPSKIESMIFEDCARFVTDADIHRIKQQVLEDQGGDGFYEFISTTPFWTAYLNEHHGEQLTAAQELIGRQKEDLQGQLAELLENPELNDHVKNTRSQELTEEFNRIEKGGLCDLSKSIIASLGDRAAS
jgi:hypothetical protein